MSAIHGALLNKVQNSRLCDFVRIHLLIAELQLENGWLFLQIVGLPVFLCLSLAQQFTRWKHRGGVEDVIGIASLFAGALCWLPPFAYHNGRLYSPLFRIKGERNVFS